MHSSTLSTMIPRNLIHIPHPASRLLQRPQLNVEGHNMIIDAMRSDPSLYNDRVLIERRNSYLKSLLESTTSKKHEDKRTSATNCDEMINIINEKLNTGYHGVRHLFKSNDPNSNGKLSRDGFRHVLYQLCGYIPPEEWVKVMRKFGLDKLEYITFDDFITHFSNNEKVKKEKFNSVHPIEMIDMTKSVGPLQLTSAYCIAVMKEKARASDFQPSDYIPDECLNGQMMILPQHLDLILENFNLSLSDDEFEKLWRRFDTENIGGIWAKKFLKQIDFNLNKLDESIENGLNDLRTQSLMSFHKSPSRAQSIASSCSRSVFRSSKKDVFKEVSKEDLEIEKVAIENIIKPSASENKIKSIMQQFKSSFKCRDKDDLIKYLNNKLNTGYIVLRTAFEYMDRESLGYLLKSDFEIILREFDVEFRYGEFEKFLQNHNLVRNEDLVNYKAFLNSFQDQGETSITQRVLNNPHLYSKNPSTHLYTANEADMMFVNFFHGFYLATLGVFKDTVGNSYYCTKEQFKWLIENRFNVLINEKQMSNLYAFIGHHEDENDILWLQFFKKFSELK